MKKLVPLAALLAFAGPAGAFQAAPAQKAFEAGKPLGVTVEGRYTPISSNVKVYGGIVSAESCAYDPTRKLIMVNNRGANQN